MNEKITANIMKRLFFFSLIFLLSINIVLAQRMIEGTVKDASTGNPLPGVNITVEGSTRGTASDAEGNFALEVTPEDEILEFSFVGYEEKEVPIEDEEQFEVLLSPESQEMEEVVVVGYGTMKKSDLTGSVSSVKSESLSKLSSSNALDALAGKLSGAQISSSSGEPGSNPIVRVRGVGTINNANPIYVVDGVILDDISFLSSGDIESVELLKDASATSIYGSRGANGVFMITTKSGSAEQSTITFSSEVGIQEIQKKIDLLNGEEFARAYNDIVPGAINNPEAVDNVDWQDMIYRDKPVMQNYNLAVSGGTEDLSYYFSGGVHDTKGIVPKSDYRRYNLKLNTDYRVREYVNIGTKISAAFVDDEIAPGVIETAYRAWPIDNPYDEDGNFAEVRGSGNPLAAIEYSNNSSDIYRLVSNLFAEFYFLENFTFKTSYQLSYEDNKNTSFTPQYNISPTQQNQRSSLSNTFTKDRTWIFENTLTYDNTIDKHNINVLAGYTAQQNTFESPGVTVYDLIRDNPDFWYLNASTNDTLFDFGSSEFTNSMVSYLFRTNYSYDNKYLFTGSLRADGSSKFAEGNRWGYFPSFALGWNIAREPFFPESRALEDVKI
ncbi:MAG: SusC/RagA family TonB-linked outer membrane protein, partial [Bacteroidales bacterium]